MITVTLIYADGHERQAKVDPGMDPYPLTIRSMRIPDLREFILHPERALQLALEQAIDKADAEGYLARMERLTAEEHAAIDRDRWQTFELVDPETLRYKERV